MQRVDRLSNKIVEEQATASESEIENEHRLAQSRQLIEALGRDDAYPHPVDRIEMAETHISWVMLTGQHAYKIKKPLRFPFLDFSTLEQRRRFCQAELDLNRRLAPELYEKVVPIGGSTERPRVGETPAIEYAVRMVQFDPERTLDSFLEDHQIPVSSVAEFAERLVAFHDSLIPTEGEPADRAAIENLEELRSDVDRDERRRLEPISRWLQGELERLEPVVRQRERDGAVRECHGDLHLGNLVWIDDRIVAFDCLEFDRRLRCIDRIDEVAFLIMDLVRHHRPGLAFEFLNRYLEVSGDYAALRLLRLFMVCRALVRSKVRHLSFSRRNDGGVPQHTTPYLDLAGRLIEYGPPVLVITQGFSGSGKTTLTRDLIARLPAVRVRSDIERKRLHGLAPGANSDSAAGGGIYSAAASDATYEVLGQAAEAALAAGINVIVDAACLERHRRERLIEVAHAQDARCVILAFEADESALRKRIRDRQSSGEDASEADLAVLEHQLESADAVVDDGEATVIRVNTNERVSPDWIVEAIESASL